MDFTTLKDELVNIADDTSITSSNQERWINRAYREIQSRADWWWMLKATTDSTVASQQAYDLPTDYRKMFEIRVDDVSFAFLDHERRNDRGTNGWTRRYSIFDQQYYLYPTPTASGSSDVDILYYKKPTDLSSGTDEPDFEDQFHEILLYLALVYYAEKERDLGDAQYFRNQAENMITQMKEFYQKQSGQEWLRFRDIREGFKTDQTESNLSTP